MVWLGPLLLLGLLSAVVLMARRNLRASKSPRPRNLWVWASWLLVTVLGAGGGMYGGGLGFLRATGTTWEGKAGGPSEVALMILALAGGTFLGGFVLSSLWLVWARTRYSVEEILIMAAFPPNQWRGGDSINPVITKWLLRVYGLDRDDAA
jgi:hypothetical protein